MRAVVPTRLISRFSLPLACLVVLLWAFPGIADSIFDCSGLGRDIVPVAGPTRALGGAVAANADPLTASIMNPCAAARARSLTITGGLVHTNTSTDNFGEAKKTIGSVFPSTGIVIPLAKFSLLTGLYVEKSGGVSFVEMDTVVCCPPVKPGAVYQASYKRETSVHSVPLLISREFTPRLILAGGVVLTACNIREETALDFLAADYRDADDVMNTQTMGAGFAAALLIDLERLSLGGLYRSGPELDGSLEKTSVDKDVWSTSDITVPSHEAFKIGVLARPLRWLSVEVDYDRCPWARLTLEGDTLSNKLVERWALGIQYRGDRLWRASRYPLSLGYYRQPVDWRDARQGSLATGEILEEVYSVGLSIPLAEERAAITLAFEAGTRAAAARDDLDEKFYSFSLSVSAMEIWRRSIKR